MSKERLTKRDMDYGVYYPYCDKTKCNGFCNSCDFEVSIMEKLAEYEDLEEQGLLLRLPCHCKDCKHVDYAGCAGTTCYCMRNGAFMQEDDFCKYAEKDEAEEKLRELEGTV